MAEHPMIILLFAVSLFLGSSNGITLQKKVSNVRELADTVNATNPEDVKGLARLVLQFQALIEGPDDDPCLPTEWSWIACSADASPRVTALYLSNQNLVGPVPDFSMMDALETIEMDYNLLTGPIPIFLGNLPNLKKLNLANNMFSGQVPASISRNKKLKTDFSGNPALFNPTPVDNTPDFGGTTTETTSSYTRIRKKKNKLPVIIGSTFVGFWAIIGVFVVFRHKAKAAQAVAQAAAAGQSGGANKPSEVTEETPINAQSTATNP